MLSQTYPNILNNHTWIGKDFMVENVISKIFRIQIQIENKA